MQRIHTVVTEFGMANTSYSCTAGYTSLLRNVVGIGLIHRGNAIPYYRFT